MKYPCLFIFFLLLLLSCYHRKAEENSQFPPEVQTIFTNKCATSGCHNDKSYQNAASLNLSSWEKLFQGAVNGSVAVPYSPFQSSLLQFVNTYPDLGLISAPTMPLNDDALSRSEVISIKQWIEKGCPNSHGQIPFAEAMTSNKAYITNQGCDLVSVVDAGTKLVMRYIKVGKEDGIIEQPHNIKVSADGKYWYVCFSNGSIIQKFDANTDALVSQLEITAGKWNVIHLSSDNKTAYISDLSSVGRIAVVDVQNMALKNSYVSGLFSNPHGIASTKNGDTIYITAQYGNMIYRFIPSLPQLDNISIQKGVAPTLTPGLLDPHEVMMSPNFDEYFITCQTSGELRILDAKTDTLKQIIPVGSYPLEMAVSKKRNLLFITCQEDANPTYPAFKGSVYVIDITSKTVVKKIYEKFYQPHGLAVDDEQDLLYVASTNASASGPAPHHASACSGRNGFYHVIDLKNYTSLRPSSEISVFPYSMAVRE